MRDSYPNVSELEVIETQDESSTEAQDFKTRQLDQLLAERIDKAFHKQTSQVCLENLAAIASEHSPIDLAHAVSMLPSSLRPILFEHFRTLSSKVQFIIHTDSCTRIAIFRYISDEAAKQLLEASPTGEVVSMLDDISEKRYRRILELLDQKKAEEIKELKAHCRNSAGRLMTSEFFAVSGEMTLGQVAERIKHNPGIEFTRRVFVVDSQGVLLGFVSARQMIVNSSYVKVKDIMRPSGHVVKPDTSREEVIDTAQRYRISGLPVVDDEGVLLGVISDGDVIESMEDIADATIAYMAGTREKFSESKPILKKFFCRAPWLFVTLLAGLLNMFIMNVFQQQEGLLLTFIFFFVPLVTGMSGNIGLQCSTILVRNMALGLLSKETQKEMMLKEICLGLFTGGVFGVLSGVIVYFLNAQGLCILTLTPLAVGIVVGVGLFGSCIVGTLLGVFAPVLFSRIGVDPAVSSGPILTAFNDFLSISIYFLIAIFLTNLFLFKTVF
jgi:magnesium transporter